MYIILSGGKLSIFDKIQNIMYNIPEFINNIKKMTDVLRGDESTGLDMLRDGKTLSLKEILDIDAVDSVEDAIILLKTVEENGYDFFLALESAITNWESLKLISLLKSTLVDEWANNKPKIDSDKLISNVLGFHIEDYSGSELELISVDKINLPLKEITGFSDFLQIFDLFYNSPLLAEHPETKKAVLEKITAKGAELPIQNPNFVWESISRLEQDLEINRIIETWTNSINENIH